MNMDEEARTIVNEDDQAMGLLGNNWVSGFGFFGLLLILRLPGKIVFVCSMHMCMCVWLSPFKYSAAYVRLRPKYNVIITVRKRG